MWLSKQNKKNKNFFEFPDCQDYDGRITIINFSTESSSKSVRLPIETFMEQIRLILVEK